MPRNPQQPPRTRFGAPAVQPKDAAGDGGYKLVLGAYLHGGAEASRLPSSLAGHAFVAVERPDGRREAFGFSPKGWSGMDPARELPRLNSGVPGVVHGDAQAFSKPGVVTRRVAISESQARAALAKVGEYRSGRMEFSASRRQCTTFVTDVAHAAGVSVGPVAPAQPRAFQDSLRRLGVAQGRFATLQPRGTVQRQGDAYALPPSFSLPQGGGRALPEAVRQKMETAFKTDFGGVRVHVGPEAPAIGALAFTVGDTIVFAPGQYDPHSMRGQQILGHELAHVVQQRMGRVRNPFGSGLAVVQDRGLEAEADRLGMLAAMGR
jgi:hypothetical protein